MMTRQEALTHDARNAAEDAVVADYDGDPLAESEGQAPCRVGTAGEWGDLVQAQHGRRNG